MMSDEIVVCEDCFFQHRTNVNFDCCLHPDAKQVYCTWNADKQVCETTAKSIRPFPKNFSVRHFAMCEPNICNGKGCTYAHGLPELNQWNHQSNKKIKLSTETSLPVRTKSNQGKVIVVLALLNPFTGN